MRTVFKGEYKNTTELRAALVGSDFYEINETPTGWSITENEGEQIAFDQGRQSVYNAGMNVDWRNNIYSRIKETAERDGMIRVFQAKLYSTHIDDSYLFAVLVHFNTTPEQGIKYAVFMYNDTAPGFHHGQYTTDFDEALKFYNEKGRK